MAASLLFTVWYFSCFGCFGASWSPCWLVSGQFVCLRPRAPLLRFTWDSAAGKSQVTWKPAADFGFAKKIFTDQSERALPKEEVTLDSCGPIPGLDAVGGRRPAPCTSNLSAAGEEPSEASEPRAAGKTDPVRSGPAGSGAWPGTGWQNSWSGSWVARWGDASRSRVGLSWALGSGPSLGS